MNHTDIPQYENDHQLKRSYNPLLALWEKCNPKLHLVTRAFAINDIDPPFLPEESTLQDRMIGAGQPPDE